MKTLKAFGLLLSCIVYFGTARGQSERVVATIDLSVPSSDCSAKITIKQSEVLTQLALQPNGKLDTLSTADLDSALSLLVHQKLLLQAARAEAHYFEYSPTEKGVQTKIEETASHFLTRAEFEKRIQQIGFISTEDPNFISLIVDRWLIEKYIDERFRRGTRTTEVEERTYYERVFVPEFRRMRPGLIIPAFEDVKTQIGASVTELKVNDALNRHIERRKRTARITIHE